MATTAQLTEESTSKYVQAGDIRMHYNEAGTGDVVICIHGGGPGASGWSNFNTNIGALSEHFRVLLTDMPGYGKSDPVTMKEPRAVYHAKAYKAFVDALGIEKATFVGNSMGGATSLKFAVEYPDRVNRLILMGAAGAGTSLFAPMPSEGIKVLNEVFRNPTRDTLSKLIKLFVYDSSFLTEELLEQRLKAILDHPEHIEARLNSTPEMVDLSGDLKKVQAKTLLVWGRDDRFTPLDHSLKFLWSLPDAQLHIFAKCGHWAQVEKAEEFNRLVIDFLTH